MRYCFSSNIYYTRYLLYFVASQTDHLIACFLQCLHFLLNIILFASALASFSPGCLKGSNAVIATPDRTEQNWSLSRKSPEQSWSSHSLGHEHVVAVLAAAGDDEGERVRHLADPDDAVEALVPVLHDDLGVGHVLLVGGLKSIFLAF